MKLQLATRFSLLLCLAVSAPGCIETLSAFRGSDVIVEHRSDPHYGREWQNLVHGVQAIRGGKMSASERQRTSGIAQVFDVLGAFSRR